MNVREMLEILTKVAQIPGGSEREVTFSDPFGSDECVEQLILSDITGVGGDYSTEVTKVLQIHSYHKVREDYLEDVNGTILKPNRPVYRSSNHKEALLNTPANSKENEGPRGGYICKVPVRNMKNEP